MRTDCDSPYAVHFINRLDDDSEGTSSHYQLHIGITLQTYTVKGKRTFRPRQLLRYDVPFLSKKKTYYNKLLFNKRLNTLSPIVQ